MFTKPVSRAYQAKDYAKMLAEKERTGAIMIRWVHGTMGVIYELRYLPQTEEDCGNNPRIA